MRAFGLLALLAAGCGETRPEPPFVERVFPREAGIVQQAALRAAETLRIHVDGVESSDYGARIAARRPEGDAFDIQIRRVDSETSALSIWMKPHDAPFAELFLRQVDAELGRPVPAGTKQTV